MATANLAATVRTTAGKGAARKLRAVGEVPAIVYGHGREPQSLAINTYTLERMLEKVSYKTTVIELEVAGGATAEDADPRDPAPSVQAPPATSSSMTVVLYRDLLQRARACRC